MISSSTNIPENVTSLELNDNSTGLVTTTLENNNNVTDGNSTMESSLLVSEHTTGTDTQSLQASTAVTVMNNSDGDSEGLGGTDLSNSDLSLLELSDEESTGTEETFTNSDASAKVTTTLASEELLNKTEIHEFEARSDSLQETKNNEDNSRSRSLKVTEVFSVSFSSSSCPAQTPSLHLD